MRYHLRSFEGKEVYQLEPEHDAQVQRLRDAPCDQKLVRPQQCRREGIQRRPMNDTARLWQRRETAHLSDQDRCRKASSTASTSLAQKRNIYLIFDTKRVRKTIDDQCWMRFVVSRSKKTVHIITYFRAIIHSKSFRARKYKCVDEACESVAE